MNTERIQAILERFSSIKVLVLGDFFLDQYLMLNRDITEKSLETHLDSYQVTEIRNSPGAAGTVANNLRALDIDVSALGSIGKDGRGFDLMRALKERKVDTQFMVESDLIMTPTYTKPMISGKDEPAHELERLDVKNRSHLPEAVENAIIDNLETVNSSVDGIIIVDQVQEENCGVLPIGFAKKFLKLVHDILRTDSGRFPAPNREISHVILKCNLFEALHTTRSGTLYEAAKVLFQQNPRGAFVTLGSDGIYVYHDGKGTQYPVSG